MGKGYSSDWLKEANNLENTEVEDLKNAPELIKVNKVFFEAVHNDAKQAVKEGMGALKVIGLITSSIARGVNLFRGA